MENTMKTCKTCKYAKPEEDYYWDDDTDEIIDFVKITCEKISAKQSYTKDQDLVKLSTSDLATTEDGSGYYSALIVGSEFGCNLHEEK